MAPRLSRCLKCPYKCLITWGAKSFRDALVDKTRRFLGIDVDPEREILADATSDVGQRSDDKETHEHYKLFHSGFLPF